jgi:hypothetical protein
MQSVCGVERRLKSVCVCVCVDSLAVGALRICTGKAGVAIFRCVGIAP